MELSPLDIEKLAMQVGIVAAGVIVAGFLFSVLGTGGGVLSTAQNGFLGQ